MTTDPRALFESDAPAGLSEDALSKLARLAERQVELEDEAESLKERAKEVGTELLRLQRETIPEVLTECGLAEGKFKLASGREIEVKEDVFPPSLGRESKYKVPVLRWLEAKGHDDLVKDVVAVNFGKGESELADRLVQLVENEFTQTLVRDRTVNAQTFKRLLRELRENGEEVPYDHLGVYVGRTTKVLR